MEGVDTPKAEQKPSGSFVLWQNTLCNPLADPISMTHSAWHDGYASAKAERKPLTDEELRECFTRTNTVEPLAEGWPGLERFARAIEAAHGIGEQT